MAGVELDDWGLLDSSLVCDVLGTASPLKMARQDLRVFNLIRPRLFKGRPRLFKGRPRLFKEVAVTLSRRQVTVLAPFQDDVSGEDVVLERRQEDDVFGPRGCGRGAQEATASSQEYGKPRLACVYHDARGAILCRQTCRW